MSRHPVVVGGLVFVGIALSLGTWAGEPPSPARVWIAGVPNAVQVGDLVVGGQPSRDGFELLAVQGYRTIVSVRGAGEIGWDEGAKVKSLGMAFVEIPMTKPVTEITDEQVAALAKVLKTAKRPILLHCGSGNRAAGLWAAYLVEHEKIPPDRALKLAEQAGMRSVRPVVEKRVQGRGSL